MTGRGAARPWSKRKATRLIAKRNRLWLGWPSECSPCLEAAGHETIERLAKELEQRFAPELAHAAEILDKIGFDRDQAEKAIAEHQQRVWQVSERGLQDTAARGKEVLAEIEKEFAESARTASGRFLAELETRSAETSHSTFEALFKSADWVREKKSKPRCKQTPSSGASSTQLFITFALAGKGRRNVRPVRKRTGSLQQELRRTRARPDAGQRPRRGRTHRPANNRSGLMRPPPPSLSAPQSSVANNSIFTLPKRKRRLNRTPRTWNPMPRRCARSLRATLGCLRRSSSGPSRNMHSNPWRLENRSWGSRSIRRRTSLVIESQAQERQFQASLTSHAAVAMDAHTERLEGNASNSWLLTTVTKLNQQSEKPHCRTG